MKLVRNIQNYLSRKDRNKGNDYYEALKMAKSGRPLDPNDKNKNKHQDGCMMR